MFRDALAEELTHVNEMRRQANAAYAVGGPDVFRAGLTQEPQGYIRCPMGQEGRDASLLLKGAESPSGMRTRRKALFICGAGPSRHGVRRGRGCRRKGVGTELFDCLKADARSRGCSAIGLDVWEFNGGALRFCRSIGDEDLQKMPGVQNTVNAGAWAEPAAGKRPYAGTQSWTRHACRLIRAR